MPEEPLVELKLADIAAELLPFGGRLTDSQLEAIREYISILRIWNQRVSLTSIAEPMEVMRRHFGESILAGQFLDFSSGRLADVGSGAGFPGLALKIAFPELEIALIEPNLKKSAFLNEVVGRLGLKSVRVVRSRYEDIQESPSKFDVICSRALGDYERLLKWSGKSLKASGKAVFWVGETDAGLIRAKAGWGWREPEAIPGSERRFILIGNPTEGSLKP